MKAILVLLLSLHAAVVSAQDARLLISVRDEQDAPIAEARVELWRTNPPPAPTTLIASRSTDALGMVELTVEPFRGYLIRATHPDFVSFEPMPLMPNDPTPRGIWPVAGDVAIPIKLRSRTYPGAVGRPPSPPVLPKGILWGRVVSSTTGKPLANISVSAHGSPGWTSGRDTRTGQDGSFRFDLVEGIYTIKAGGDPPPVSARSSPVFTAYERSADVKASVVDRRQTRVNFALTPVRFFNITVTVIDDQGLALPGASVFADAKSMGAAWQTGPDGSVLIGPVRPGPVRIAVEGIKDDRSLVGSATIEVENTPFELTMPLVASGTVSGRVEFVDRVDILHGSGGLRVTHTTPGVFRGESTQDPSGRVGATGEFTVMHTVGEQCLRLTGLPPGWRLRDITYNGEDYKERPFSLPSGESLSGVVIHVEQGPSDASLSRDCSGPVRRR